MKNNELSPYQFKQLYEEYYKKIYNYIFKSTLNRETTEDITSNTFFKAFSFIKNNSPKIDNFNAWIYKIATNEIIKFMEKSKKNKNEVYNDEIIDNVASHTDEQEILDQYDNLNILHKAIDKLKPKEKIIINLNYFEKKSLREISKILNINENTLRPKKTRILRKLKMILDNLNKN